MMPYGSSDDIQELQKHADVLGREVWALNDFIKAVRVVLRDAGHCGDGNLADMVKRALGEAKEAGRAEMREISEALMNASAEFPDGWDGTIAERVQRLRREADFFRAASAAHREDCDFARKVAVKQSRAPWEVLQQEVMVWTRATFPKQTPESILKHFAKEAKELVESGTEEEAADCALLLLDYADRVGFSLYDAIRDKFAIIKRRKWQEPDADGVVEHVRDQKDDG